MTQEEFEMSRNLLKDVISKQTGSLTKALKELVQNSRDAGATVINIVINENEVIVEDNGRGMSKEDIYDYFRVFGETTKRDNDENLGQFGMGRGQIMNFGICIWRTKHSKISVNIREFLGYNIDALKTNVKGCKVSCKFYKKAGWWELEKARKGIQYSLLPTKNIDIFVDEKLLNPIIEVLEQFTDNNFDVFVNGVVKNTVYCRELSVKTFDSNFNYCINVKAKAELNFARNEFLETDPMFEEIKAKMNEVEELMTITKDNFDNREARQTLQFVREGRVSIESVFDKPIIRTATDKKLSIAEIIGKEIMFGECNIWSDDCIRRGHIVIHDDNEYLIHDIVEKFKLEVFLTGKNPKDVAKRGYHRDFSEENLRKNKIYGKIPADLDKYIFKPLGEKFDRDVYLGESDVHGGWTNGYDTIHINKNNIELSSNKEEICLKIWHILCHEYSHTRDTKKKDYHSNEFYENYHDITKKTINKIAEYIRTVSAKRLKELYF